MTEADASKPVNGTRCKAHGKHSKKPCGNFAVNGLEVCRMHGGSSKRARAAGERRVAEQKAVAVVAKLGIPIEADPLETMLDQVREAAGNVAFLREKVQGLPEIAAMTAFGPAVDAHVTLYNKEREFLSKLCESCIKVGLAERQVRIAEKQGELIADYIRAVLNDPEAGLNTQQREKVRVVAIRHLRLLNP